MAKILIVCRDADEGRALARLVRRDGHRAVRARTGAETEKHLAADRPELLVLSVPDPGGLLRELARPIGSLIRRTPALAVVHEHDAAEVDRDQQGILEVLPTPFTEEAFLAKVDAVLRVRDVLFGAPARSEGDAEAADEGAHEGKSAWSRLLGDLAGLGRTSTQRKDRPLGPYLETAASIVGTVEVRDDFDPGHGQRVASHCASIATHMKLGAEDRDRLLYAASVHDIGKISYPAELLRKQELSEPERRMLRFHPRRSADLINALTPYHEVADIVRYHHERPDGRAYYARPAREVPMLARVLCVADVFDGLTSHHAGTPPFSPEQAMEILKAGRGTLYDADCVDAVLAVVRPVRFSIPVSRPVAIDVLLGRPPRD